MSVSSLAGAIGRGLFAGAVGTAAMTISSTVEAKLRKRESSSAPADAAARVLGVKPEGEEEKQRFGRLVHWAYGTGWGAVRGALGWLGLGPGAGTVAHYGIVWGTEMVMLPSLDVAPPPTEWESKELGIDAMHHAVYAIATGAAYTFLERRD